MKDFRGVRLKVGDSVAVAYQPYRNRYDLVEGVVQGFTAKMVRWAKVDEPGTFERPYLASPYKMAVIS